MFLFILTRSWRAAGQPIRSLDYKCNKHVDKNRLLWSIRIQPGKNIEYNLQLEACPPQTWKVKPKFIDTQRLGNFTNLKGYTDTGECVYLYNLPFPSHQKPLNPPVRSLSGIYDEPE